MANKSVQLSDGTNNIFPVLPTAYTGSVDISAPTSVETASGTILTLPPGAYIVLGYMQWSTGFNYVVNFSLTTTYQRTVRASAYNGGGCMNCTICTSTSNINITAKVWQNSGSTRVANVSVQAVKIR